MKKELISKKVLDAITPMLPKDCIRVLILCQEDGDKMLSDVASNMSREDVRAYLRALLNAMYEEEKMAQKKILVLHSGRKSKAGVLTASQIKKAAKILEKASIKRGPGRPKGSKNKKG